MGRSSKSQRRLGALVLGALLAPVLGECAYRATRLSGLSPTTNPTYVVHDAALGWRYRPGTHARHAAKDFDVEVEINASGFRGPEWTAPRPDEKRLLVLGDSLAFGWGVRADEAFAARVDAQLDDWQVINAAISGTSTGQQLLLLDELFADPDFAPPAAVVCAFCANDLFENGSAVVYGKRKPWFELVAGEPVLHGQPVTQSWLERVSLLWRAMQKRSWEETQRAQARDLEAEWQLELALLTRMRGTLDSGIALLVLSESDELAAFCAGAEGLVHVDARPALARVSGPVVFEHDPHWNAAGHAAVAELLAARLTELWPPGSNK